MSDREIMMLVKEGFVDKLGVLFERHNKKLYNFFLGLTGCHYDSDDLVQEVFLRIMRYSKSFKGKGAFATWMYRIGYNCYYDRHKSLNNYEKAEIDLNELPAQAEQLNILYEKEQTEFVHEALRQLKDKDRAILLMSMYLRLKYREIAQIMCSPEGSVKARAFFALKRLRKIYVNITNERFSASRYA